MDDYRPRPDDHSVEPFFAGLGVSETPDPASQGSSWGPVLAWIAGLGAGFGFAYWLFG